MVTNKPLIRKFKKKILAAIEEAVEFAENSEYPRVEELLKDVY